MKRSCTAAPGTTRWLNLQYGAGFMGILGLCCMTYTNKGLAVPLFGSATLALSTGAYIYAKQKNYAKQKKKVRFSPDTKTN